MLILNSHALIRHCYFVVCSLPNLNNCRFKPAIVKKCIREIVRERLSGMHYDPEEVPQLTSSLAECIKDKVKGILSKLYFSDMQVYQNKTKSVEFKSRLKSHYVQPQHVQADCASSTGLGFNRYKLVVQVVIGEQRGQGVKWVRLGHSGNTVSDLSNTLCRSPGCPWDAYGTLTRTTMQRRFLLMYACPCLSYMRVFTHKTNRAFLFLCATGQPVLCSDGVWKLLLLRIEGRLQEKPPHNHVKCSQTGWWRVCSHGRLHTSAHG